MAFPAQAVGGLGYIDNLVQPARRFVIPDLSVRRQLLFPFSDN
jgi:hypothetical protein